MANQSQAFGARALRAALDSSPLWGAGRSEEGKVSLIKGVAKDRCISVEDGQMRHGRKSRSVRVDGYKCHVLHDLDTGLIRAVSVTPANAPEASVTEAISADLTHQGTTRIELAHRSSLFE